MFYVTFSHNQNGSNVVWKTRAFALPGKNNVVIVFVNWNTALWNSKKIPVDRLNILIKIIIMSLIK